MKFFTTYEGPKILLKYEELITEPVRSIGEIARFLGKDAVGIRVSELEKEWPRLFDLCRNAGARSWMPASSGADVSHHQRNAGPELVNLVQIEISRHRQEPD